MPQRTVFYDLTTVTPEQVDQHINNKLKSMQTNDDLIKKEKKLRYKQLKMS